MKSSFFLFELLFGVSYSCKDRFRGGIGGGVVFKLGKKEEILEEKL